MAFFQLPEPQPEGDLEAWVDYRPPRNMPWLGPGCQLPGAVPEPHLMFRSDRAAVAIARISVFSAGFTCVVESFIHPEFTRSPEAKAILDRRFSGFDSGSSDEELRFGVLFADGGKATSLDEGRSIASCSPDDDEDPEPPDGPLLAELESTSFGTRSEATYWIWPLPPPGPVTFVCEWPALQVPETRLEIDAAVFHAAAHSAREIWPE